MSWLRVVNGPVRGGGRGQGCCRRWLAAAMAPVTAMGWVPVPVSAVAAGVTAAAVAQGAAAGPARASGSGSVPILSTSVTGGGAATAGASVAGAFKVNGVVAAGRGVMTHGPVHA